MTESTIRIKKQTVTLFEQYFQATDEETKIFLENEIIVLNLNFALHKASKYRHTSVLEEDDIITAAYTGLMFAVRTYDSSKAQFSTYANRVIENEINDAIRKAARKKNNLNAVSLDQEVFSDSSSTSALLRIDTLADSVDIEACLIKRRQFEQLLEVCENILDETEWTVIQNSIKPNDGRMTQYDLGVLLSSSQTTISRIEKRAFKKVREFLENQEWGLELLR